jgi:FtsH-binding integral membrane protein
MDINNRPQYSEYTVVEGATKPLAKTFMANVFLWMFAALAISAFFAYLFAGSENLMGYLITETAKGTGLSMLGWIVMLSPIGFVLLLSYGFQRLSAPLVMLLFVLFAAIMGISLSFTLLHYTSTSVIGCFSAASVMFGVMAVMGYTTDKDLTSFGRLMQMGLIGIVIAMLINYFIGSERMDYIISIIGVMVFTGLTAYDVQTLKRIGQGMEYEGVNADDTRKMSVIGAMRLYLDFINLFLMLLRLFGGKRD